jgi:holo-[acyl-carrier protein] synthase
MDSEGMNIRSHDRWILLLPLAVILTSLCHQSEADLQEYTGSVSFGGVTMIAGVGIDHVELQEFSDLMQQDKSAFLDRIFTAAEIAAGDQRQDRLQYFSGRFAAKEALMKALGTGWTDEFDWKDIEVTALASGAPDVRLSGNVLLLAKSIPAGKIHLSISHTSHVALAQAVIERSS